jgi:hypothetical protein
MRAMPKPIPPAMKNDAISNANGEAFARIEETNPTLPRMKAPTPTKAVGRRLRRNASADPAPQRPSTQPVSRSLVIRSGNLEKAVPRTHAGGASSPKTADTELNCRVAGVKATNADCGRASPCRTASAITKHHRTATMGLWCGMGMLREWVRGFRRAFDAVRLPVDWSVWQWRSSVQECTDSRVQVRSDATATSGATNFRPVRSTTRCDTQVPSATTPIASTPSAAPGPLPATLCMYR